MPPLPGEERVLTLFADIHYYFTTPTPKPLLHRFDKSSYLYLYHNASQQKTRIEVANNPGTPEQDAFNGALDKVHLRHSTRFPSLCTITVDGQTQSQGGYAYPPPPGSANPYEWQLPISDPRGENHLQRLHTLDIYFWTQGDADQFLDLIEQYLPRAQVETDRNPYPAPPEVNTTSTIVQQLENVAITDPAYQNGQTRNSQSQASVISPAPVGLPPPPPLGGPTPTHQHTSSISPLSAEQKRDSAQFTPLPYNPAAPAAPEPIKHREKTPPPPDAADGTGLAAAIAADHGVPYNNPTQPPVGGYIASPPQTSPYSLPGAYASPPPSAGLSFSPHSQSSIQSPPVNNIPSYPPQPQAQSQLQSPPVPSYPPGYLTGTPGPNAANPTAHLYGTPQPQHQPQFQHQPQQSQQIQQQQQQQQQPPSFYGTQVPSIGGYSNYSYDQAPKQHSQSSSEYDIHNQMYRPTEAEAGSHLQDHAKLATQSQGQRPRKLEDKAARVESGVNRFLKKLEKKL
ncbi:hypothetical protein BJY04DRAFT_214060 [Aspergillus karnatakaensis]|uniref:uncharacterized protein n=1 Tax=Aspergillus karnatakaensis TaxID=1810916 RepID=UPI003CCE0440